MATKTSKAVKAKVEVQPVDKKPVVNPKPIVKEMEPMKETKMTLNLPLVILAGAIIVAGGFTGYVLASNRSGGVSGGMTSTSETAAGLKKVVGLADDKVGKDEAEGVLQAGGIDGEGSHHLERDGGPSQNVYLTSSVVPLDDYVGKKVKVKGQTFAAEKAGWFMDVGRLELLE